MFLPSLDEPNKYQLMVRKDKLNTENVMQFPWVCANTNAFSPEFLAKTEHFVKANESSNFKIAALKTGLHLDVV